MFQAWARPNEFLLHEDFQKKLVIIKIKIKTGGKPSYRKVKVQYAQVSVEGKPYNHKTNKQKK